MDIERNIQAYLHGSGTQHGVVPEGRYASFDYCYNYFQAFRERDALHELAAPAYLQQSCLQLGFYLASWGMLRGSTFLLQKSAKFYVPLIRLIADTDRYIWEIDADEYTDENIARLLAYEESIANVFASGGRASATLVTKIMLGVFGNVPAFDQYLVYGLKMRWSARGLRRIRAFYQEHQATFDQYDIRTLDFATGQPTNRRYPKAKLIDMVGFIAGQQ
jgi:hypothetical protein